MGGKSQRKKPSGKWQRYLESKRKSTKRTSLGVIHQTDKSGNLIYDINASEVSSNVASKEGLKYLYTNADQFVNKRDELVMLIAEDKPDVIFITEVIPKSQVNPITWTLLEIDGYKPLLNFDPDNLNLGASGIIGVAIYSKKTLSVIEVELMVDETSDHVWIKLPTNNQKSILCGCVYRSPSNDTDSNKCMQSTKAIMKLINTAYQRNSNLNLNYKNIDWKNEFAPSGQQHLLDFIETLQECYLYQHVTKPTPNLLDFIFISEEGMVQDLNYLPPLGESDHVCLRFNVLQTQRTNAKPPVHNVFKTNYDAVKEDLDNYNWQELLNSNFEEDYNMFFNILSLSGKTLPNAKAT